MIAMSNDYRRPLGSSNIMVAPLALGGNVFGWTADEATSFRILDAFVDAGGTMIDTADVYSAWAPGHSGGESETVIGNCSSVTPAKRARSLLRQRLVFMAGLEPDTMRPHATHRSVGWGSMRSTCTTSIRTMSRSHSLRALAHSRHCEGQARSARPGSAISPRRGVEEALSVAHSESLDAAVAVQGWYNLLERKKYEAELQDVVTARGLSFFHITASPTGF